MSTLVEKHGELRESGAIKMNNRTNKRTSNRSGGCLGFTMFIVPIAIIVLFIGIYLWRSYNGIIEREEAVKKTWADVETEYKRRADLIPNLIQVVKGYADFEKSTLIGVQEARSKATSIQVNADNLDDATIEKFQEAQGQLSSALSRLLVTVERYPDLKANNNFMSLQNKLSQIEDAILAQHKIFNGVVEEYNVNLRKFPKNIVASIFGFEEIMSSFDIKKQGYIKAKEGQDEAPEVQF